MAKKHFYFPFYPDIFIRGTLTMSCEEKGAYIQLLCYQWDNGSIPNDQLKLSRICGVEESFDFGEIFKKFPNGKNPKMIEVMKKTEEKSEKAKKSIEARYENNMNETRTKHERNTNVILSKVKSKYKVKDKVRKDTPAKAGTPQAAFVDNWQSLYKAKTGQDYKADRKDYILIANLLKKYPPDAVFNKAKILFSLCEGGKTYFAKSMADFTIGKLSNKWNEILPHKDKSEKLQDDIQKAVREMERENAII